MSKIKPYITDECDALIEAAVKKMVDAGWSYEDMIDEFNGAVDAALHRLGRSDISGDTDD